MHSERAAVPPAVPCPAATPSAPLASCSVINPHAVRPLPPGFAAATVAAGAVTGEVAAEGGVAEWVRPGAEDDCAAPQLASSRQPAVASRALLVQIPIMMISFGVIPAFRCQRDGQAVLTRPALEGGEVPQRDG